MSDRAREMPTLQEQSRKRSPLENREPTSKEVQIGCKAVPPVVKSAQVSKSECVVPPVVKSAQVSKSECVEPTVTAIASAILTSRQCGLGDECGVAVPKIPGECGGVNLQENSSSLPISGLVAMSEEMLPRLLEEVKKLWKKRFAACIEVYGWAPQGDHQLSSSSLPGPRLSSNPSSGPSSGPQLSCGMSAGTVSGPVVLGASTLLLEVWSIEVTAKKCPLPSMSTSQLLLQAVQSHLHFSQIRSWQEVGVSGNSHTPFHLLYRVCSFDGRTGWSVGVPVQHTFPLLGLVAAANLKVSVLSLPRLSGIPHQLLNGSIAPHYHSLLTYGHTSADAIQTATEQMGTVSDQTRIGSDRIQIQVATDQVQTSTASLDCFPFSPPTPSPLSPKLLAGLADRLPPHVPHSSLVTVSGSQELGSMQLLSSSPGEFKQLVPSSPEGYGDLPIVQDSEYRELCSSAGASGSSVGTSSVEELMSGLRMDSGTNGDTATFEPAPRAPGSPAPFAMASTVKRRSCALTCKRPLVSGVKRVQRCNSAPVNISSLCLLGTFEESILNGRLEPCGSVQGFKAEMAASGSFCPPHLMLPVTAAFYDLHDNYGGTSPYLGQVDLSSVGRRGYHVPRKGTVQVTLFNPNHTVVKMYIVPYDFSDMPACSQTFLRQKTVSYPSPSWTSSATPTGRRGCGNPPYLPSLHYLIHLSFLCSKSKRVYLHRDIRMIFARHAPDTEPGDSQVTLHTVTDSPEEPKYSPSAVNK